MFPSKSIVREKCFNKKKVDCCIMRFVRNDKRLAMQLDGRVWTIIYIIIQYISG